MTSDAKLYGIELEDGSVSQVAIDVFGVDAATSTPLILEPGERVVEIVAVKAERLRALEAAVLAADRMRGEADAILSVDSADPTNGDRFSIHGDLLLDLNGAMNDYDTARAIVGPIGG